MSESVVIAARSALAQARNPTLVSRVGRDLGRDLADVARRLTIAAMAPRIAALYPENAVAEVSPMTEPIPRASSSEVSMFWPPAAEPIARSA